MSKPAWQIREEQAALRRRSLWSLAVRRRKGHSTLLVVPEVPPGETYKAMEWTPVEHVPGFHHYSETGLLYRDRTYLLSATEGKVFLTWITETRVALGINTHRYDASLYIVEHATVAEAVASIWAHWAYMAKALDTVRHDNSPGPYAPRSGGGRHIKLGH